VYLILALYGLHLLHLDFTFKTFCVIIVAFYSVVIYVPSFIYFVNSVAFELSHGIVYTRSGL